MVLGLEKFCGRSGLIELKIVQSLESQFYHWINGRAFAEFDESPHTLVKVT
ncbi:hypothetical protein [Rhodococcus globerulus]|uniref:hypothetical protein n=1 Tax=Rhodococcus globerulus TaxID=33008 RepID=UPI0012B5FDD5|nr:hypothetical protein [Rhodococcus globerulus]MCE4265335.1 hypothetical protein [Rhodococcus globerulus]